MLNASPMLTAARRQRRIDKITEGGRAAVCYRCGFDELPALEVHHLANRVNDMGLTATTCRNCHRVLTENNTAEGVPTRYETEPTDLDRVVASIAAAGVVLVDLGEMLRRHALLLDALSSNLNGVPGLLR